MIEHLYEPASPTVGAIAAALSKAQSTITHAAKTHSNPQTRSKYADLTGIIDVAREPLTQNGLALVQAPYHLPGDPPTVVLVTTVLHESGEWLRSVTPVNARKMVKGGEYMVADDMQTIGSAITYARRYALASMLGIGQEDDDGNQASGRTSAPAARQAPAARRNEPAPARVDAGPPLASGEDPFFTAAESFEHAPGPNLITADQVKALGAAMTKHNLKARDDRLAFTAWLVKRPLKSSKELTSVEASRMIGWSDDQWSEALADYAVSLLDEPEKEEAA